MILASNPNYCISLAISWVRVVLILTSRTDTCYGLLLVKGERRGRHHASCAAAAPTPPSLLAREDHELPVPQTLYTTNGYPANAELARMCFMMPEFSRILSVLQCVHTVCNMYVLRLVCIISIILCILLVGYSREQQYAYLLQYSSTTQYAQYNMILLS